LSGCLTNLSKDAPVDLVLKPVISDRLYVQIARQIADAVQQELLNTGDKLPSERLLADQLGVSRPSVREALSALEILGIVESRTGDGTYIRRPPTEWTYMGTIFDEFAEREESPLEILEARFLLEPQIARLAAERATPDGLTQIESYLLAMENAFESSVSHIEADTGFHIAIANATTNSMLVRQIQLLVSTMQSRLWTSLNQRAVNDPALAHSFLEDHRRIYTAIHDRNPDRADEKMSIHISKVIDDFFS
jgi:GntR family transcriptional regulator, transcriptional repressor for pyruvate dehydrogenase complex